MLYSILLVLLLTLTIVALCFLSFRWGVRFGKDPQATAERSITPNLPRKKRQEDPELGKMRQILENVENYTGDGSNQRKIG